MSEIKKFPFTIHALAPEGLTLVSRAVTPFTADAITLYPGDSLEITESVYELNKDRDGASWFDLTPEAQKTEWGVQRFGVGPVPEGVKLAAEAAHRERLRAERDNLLHTNPHLAKTTAASRRLDELNAALKG